VLGACRLLLGLLLLSLLLLLLMMMMGLPLLLMGVLVLVPAGASPWWCGCHSRVAVLRPSVAAFALAGCSCRGRWRCCCLQLHLGTP